MNTHTKTTRRSRRVQRDFSRPNGISAITSKGQVTIPAQLRQALGIKPGDRVLMLLNDDDSVRLRRIPTLAEVVRDLKVKVEPFDKSRLGGDIEEEVVRQTMKNVWWPAAKD